MANRQDQLDVLGTVSSVADRAADVATTLGDRAAELIEKTLSTTADTAKSVGDTVAHQLDPKPTRKTTVGGVINRAAKTAAKQNRKVARAGSRATKRAAKATKKAATRARKSATKTARQTSSTAKRAAKSVRTGTARAAKTVRGAGRSTKKRGATKRGKKR